LLWGSERYFIVICQSFYKMVCMNEYVISSWEEIMNILYSESRTLASIGRFRSDYVYRGLSDKEYRLDTVLMRLGGKYWELEPHLVRNFIKYTGTDPSEHSIWSWLSIARHHGLPTRLLDWTYSPLVAMHFATSNINKYDRDGIIWCVDYIKIHEFLPAPFRKLLEKENADIFTTVMLNKIYANLEDLPKMEGEFTLFFEPPSMDERIINQFALHSVTSSPGLHLEDILKKHPELYKRIIIPKEIKWEIRDKLDQSNIHERVLFPGLDGLSMWLTRYYQSKKPGS